MCKHKKCNLSFSYCNIGDQLDKHLLPPAVKIVCSQMYMCFQMIYVHNKDTELKMLHLLALWHCSDEGNILPPADIRHITVQ